MIRTVSLCFAALAMVACSASLSSGPGAGAYKTIRGRTAVPVPDSTAFEVLAAPGDAGRELFCAAGDYAYSRLGARPSDRVVLAAPSGPSVTVPGRRAAAFKVLPPDEAPPMPSVNSISIRDVGWNYSVANARFFCNRLPYRHS